MKETMSMERFAEQVCQCVQAALPRELDEADVYATKMDIGDGDTRMMLLVIRPWIL